MVVYMLRMPEASQKDRDKPDVLSKYIDDGIERVMLWGAKLCMKTGKSVEIVSFSATQNGTRMKEYGEFQIRRDYGGLVWIRYRDWALYKVNDTSYPIKMTKVGRI